MSVIKQPFQQLPFSPNIEFQWRLRSDCFNDICDVPIIPKGKLVPFFIVAESDTIGDFYLVCHDEPFEYVRTEIFYKEGCEVGEPVGVEFSKTYYSTTGPLRALQMANADTNFYVEGQEYANTVGVCETNYALDSNGDIFTDSNGDRFLIY